MLLVSHTEAAGTDLAMATNTVSKVLPVKIAKSQLQLLATVVTPMLTQMSVLQTAPLLSQPQVLAKPKPHTHAFATPTVNQVAPTHATTCSLLLMTPLVMQVHLQRLHPRNVLEQH